MLRDKRRRGGYYDLGTPRMPLPSFIAFEDRETGAIWYLSRGTSDSSERVVLTDTLRAGLRTEYVLFGPNEGPYLHRYGLPSVRLFVRSGRLGYEEYPYDEDVHFFPVLTRTGVSATVSEVRIPEGFSFGDELVYEVLP